MKWLEDSGSGRHMCTAMFENLELLEKPIKFSMALGDKITAKRCGDVILRMTGRQCCTLIEMEIVEICI